MNEAPAPLGVGVIGLGEIGQQHLRSFDRAAGSRVVAVADLDPGLREQSAEARGAAAYSDYRELLADPAVEVVSVCLPHSLHLPVALEAAAAGKHLLVEKPLALNVAECDEVISAVEAAGVTAAVQHNQIYYPPHVRAREMIDSGELGELLHLRLRLGIGGKYGGWRSDPAVTGGGLLHDAGVHRLYVARFLGGEVEQVSALTDRPRAQGEDQAVIAIGFSCGALGVVDVNYNGPSGMFDDAIEIVGTDGALYLSGCEADFEGFRTGPALRQFRDGAWSDVKVAPGDWADSIDSSVAAFVEAVAEGREPPVTLQDGRRIVELIEAAHASADGARPDPGAPA